MRQSIEVQLQAILPNLFNQRQEETPEEKEKREEEWREHIEQIL